MTAPGTPPKGRGTGSNPKNRFTAVSYELIAEEAEPGRPVPTRYYRDRSKSVLARNESPDIGFTYDLNPYRGCEHGCIYCYARPTHEYLGFSAGLDFETRIMVKPNAAELLEKELASPRWSPQVIAVGGNTDCYQPVERRLGITRRCIEVLLKYRNPFSIITKNQLITRDIDLLQELARQRLLACTVTVTTLDKDLQRRMEPRTAPPDVRLETIRRLAEADIPVDVNIAPVIPGLNDSEIPAILRRAREHGATRAHWIMLRLPHGVKDLFVEWLRREYPDRAERVLNRIREVRDGGLNDAAFGARMRGAGEMAESIRQLFDVTAAKYGYVTEQRGLRTDLFRGPHDCQMSLTFE